MKNLLFLLVLAVSVCGQGASSDAPFFGNAATNLYYPKACAEAGRIPAAYRAAFYSQKEAEEKGFRRAEKCTGAAAAFESVPNVLSKPAAASAVIAPENPLQKAGRRIKNLAEIDRNLAAFLDQVVIVTASVKVGGFYGDYLDADKTHNAFEIYDGSIARGTAVYVYMTRGESAENLCRRITTAEGEVVFGVFTFRITGETFWQRSGDRFALLGDLLEYELQPANK